MKKANIQNEIREAASHFCEWAVVYDIPGNNYDDGQERTGIVATFNNRWNADDFIAKCLPKQSRTRFYVVRM